MTRKILLTSLAAMLSVGTAFAADPTYLDTTALTNACQLDPLSSSQVSAKAATLTATWTPITYSIKFNKNGGSGTDMANQSMTYDVAANLTTNTYTKSGSVFRGWDTASGGTTVVHTDGKSVSNLSSTQDAIVNLYAVWGACAFTNGSNSTQSSASTATGNKCQYTVTCKTGYHVPDAVANGSMTMSNKTVTISSKTATSYVITGPAGVYSGIAMTDCVSDNIALTWVGGYEGSTYSQSNTCEYGGAIALPTTSPTRTGYTFDKWKVHDN